VPSLFCFMVLSKMILRLNASSAIYPILKPLSKLLHISKEEASCFFVGNLCGFPSGAQSVCEVSNECDDPFGTLTLSTLCNNVSPGFMISFVGNILLGSKSAGLAIYFSQLSASVMIGAVARRKIKVCEKSKTGSYESFPAVFCSSVADSASSCILLTGFIVFFSVLSSYAGRIIDAFGVSAEIKCALCGVFEIAGGCRGSAALPPLAKFAYISFLCSFSGICVIFQSAPYLLKCRVNMLKYTLLKLLQGAVGCAVSVSWYLLFAPSVPVFGERVSMQDHGYFIEISVFLTALYMLFSVIERKRIRK
ncbi:MAG: hypothetical protein IKN38_02380, partial [Clostridia bacterium]|nr:hypothetical protein [Clostridia bacterium]